MRGAHFRSYGGFTLIEILVVIGLISLLFVALAPMFTEAEETEKIAVTRALVGEAEMAAKLYEAQRSFGDYPPDDFKDMSVAREPLAAPPDNGVNSGIESFLVFVNRKDSREGQYPERDDRLVNTDDDRAPAGLLGKLERGEKVELADAWGNPFVYFHKRNYASEQNCKMADGDEVQAVQAWKTKDGTWVNARSFQIFSAGPDQVFNTRDDIGNFETPEQE